MSFSCGFRRRAIVSTGLAIFALGAVSPAFALTVSGTPATTAKVNAAYTFKPTTAGAKSTVTFSVTNRPAWAVFAKSTGHLYGTPTAANVGTTSNIVISASDGTSTARLAAFSIKVSAATTTNHPPTLSGTPPATATVGAAYSYRPTYADADGDTLTFSITNRPAWALFATSNGHISGTPTAANVGTTSNIILRVSDGKTTTSLAPFSIKVNASGTANRAPTIAGTPAKTASVGVAYSFRPTASDPDGNALTFSIVNKPSWATFSTSSGQLSGTPTTTGTTSNITIKVSDGKLSASLPAFALQVTTATTGNHAPTITGTPATTATVGAAYSFRPTASDADGNALTFTIANKPAWTTFSASTGQLSGTPATAQVGTTSNITITVSDGKSSTALKAFSIKVSGASSGGSVTLDWTPPTRNTDGSSLTNIAGYRIIYGTSASALTKTIQIANPGLTSYLVENLAAGTWYFSIKTYNSLGTESTPTTPVSGRVQ